MNIVERYGFRIEAPFFTRRFDLTGELVPRLLLEHGFVIVDMKSHPDEHAQAFCVLMPFRRKTRSPKKS